MCRCACERAPVCVCVSTVSITTKVCVRFKQSQKSSFYSHLSAAVSGEGEVCGRVDAGSDV